MKKFFKYGTGSILVILLLLLALEQFVETRNYKCTGLITMNDDQKISRVSYVRTVKQPRLFSKWLQGRFYIEMLSEAQNYLETSQSMYLKDDKFHDIGAIYQDGKKLGGLTNTNIVSVLELKFDYGRYSATCAPISKN